MALTQTLAKTRQEFIAHTPLEIQTEMFRQIREQQVVRKEVSVSNDPFMVVQNMQMAVNRPFLHKCSVKRLQKSM